MGKNIFEILVGVVMFIGNTLKAVAIGYMKCKLFLTLLIITNQQLSSVIHISKK